MTWENVSSFLKNVRSALRELLCFAQLEASEAQSVDVLFSQLFLVWAASLPPADLTVKDQVQAVQNFKNAAHYDLKTVKIVMPDGSAHSVVKAAKRIIAAMEEFYADFGESVHDCLAFQRRKFEEPECRYAWKIREQYGQGFVARGLQLARQRQREYLEER